ncbi:hypothetical protein OOZ51_00460 [Arthrobacter sp. MI7-26]|uniref:hypothetical protein n=1 Tax=Arthrobacter sp. MI7-26 TaxID=2993653 RepID=UPI00224883B4|nr:hypothetical protein [Arthrobacter sp. MI7-26]MCX2746284.1 hypothetical protein [Arthrobacter sp. MI7-26]
MFSFTEGDGFDGNLAKFLEHMKDLDPVQGQILIDLASTISSDDTIDRTRMRTSFDAEVLKRLDEEPLVKVGGETA